jgi:tetratricopeptide (TPR) repeat protein
VFFHRFNLRSSGKTQKGGWAFLAFSILWVGLTAHSGWVRYHEYAGSQAFQKIQIPDELALAQTNPDPWLSPTDRETILEGKKHFQSASNFGLFKNGDALSKLAWFEYLSGDAEQAVALLSQAATHQKGQAKALSLYYRGTIMNRLGRYEQARASLDEALEERPDLILARQEKGGALWQLGRKEEAISAWTYAVLLNPKLALTSNQLAGAKRSLGKVEEAIAHEKQADQFTPDDPLYHWMIGLRLKNLGMSELAEKHFQRAIQLDPRYQANPR